MLSTPLKDIFRTVRMLLFKSRGAWLLPHSHKITLSYRGFPDHSKRKKNLIEDISWISLSVYLIYRRWKSIPVIKRHPAYGKWGTFQMHRDSRVKHRLSGGQLKSFLQEKLNDPTGIRANAVRGMCRSKRYYPLGHGGPMDFTQFWNMVS